MCGEQLSEQQLTPREFFDQVMADPNAIAAQTALSFSEDIETATKFLEGYVDKMQSVVNRDVLILSDVVAHGIAESRIRNEASKHVSIFKKHGLNSTEQLAKKLGVWPEIFSAVKEHFQASDSNEQAV